MRYPENLLMDVRWSFDHGQYSTQAEFILAFNEYNKAIDEEEMDTDEIIFELPKIVIVYDDFEDDFEDEDMDGDDFEANTVLLTADNGASFTAGELLYKLNQTIGVLLEEDDAHFFEGLNFITDEDEDYPGLPVYYMNLGS